MAVLVQKRVYYTVVFCLKPRTVHLVVPTGGGPRIGLSSDRDKACEAQSCVSDSLSGNRYKALAQASGSLGVTKAPARAPRHSELVLMANHQVTLVQVPKQEVC